MDELDYIKMKYFRMFFEIANAGSFTKAAQNLYISQTLLTKDIRKFEDLLEVKLFERNTRNVTLTKAGEYLLTNGQGIFHALESCCQKARSMQLKEKSVLSLVGLNTADMDLYLFPYIAAYKAEHPDQVIDITSDYMTTIEKSVYYGEYDIGIIPDFETDSVDRYGLQWTWWTKSNSEVIIPTANPLSEKKTVTLKELKDLTFIILSGEHHDRYVRYLKKIFLPYNDNLRLGTAYKNAYTLRDTFFQETDSVLFTDTFFFFPEKKGFKRISVSDHESGTIAIWKPDNRKAEEFLQWKQSMHQ